MGKGEQGNSGTRWWEFYTIRYGMGAVIGGVLFAALCRDTPALRTLFSLPKEGSVTGAELGLLAAYGLTYCYIASAPILVFHTARFGFTCRSSIKRCSKAELCILGLLATIILATGCFSAAALGNKPDNEHGLLAISVCFAYIVLILLEGACIWLSLRNVQAMFDFYQKLAEKRELAQGEIVDSYRHLREHGNSFFIVTLELLLAVILYSIGKTVPNHWQLTVYMCVIAAWLAPAAFVWLVSTSLERQFLERYKKI